MDATEILPASGKEIEIVKLAFLATSGDVKTNHGLSRQASNAGRNLKTVLLEALKEQSVKPVRDFANKELSQFIEMKTKYSFEARWPKWLPKANFLMWIETMRYLNLDVAPLTEVEEEVKNKACMDNIDKVKGAFMFNENLVMSEICDIMTIEHVKALGNLCFKKGETVNFDGVGMKELAFFYIIRDMELMGRFDTLFTDRLLGYLKEIRPTVGDQEKLDQVCEILERYEIRVQPAGYCLVFWVNEDRPGAEKETDNINYVFGELLGYEVKVVENPDKATIKEYAKQCFDDLPLSIYDSLVCWVLGHGDSKSIKLANKKDKKEDENEERKEANDENKKEDEIETIDRDELLKLFAKETCFSKKPKLFFMGSCQGGKTISPKTSPDDENIGRDGDVPSVSSPTLSDANIEIATVHTESDRLVAYATMPDHAAFRSEETGSLFVSFICEQIAQLTRQPDASINVLRILQRTARKMQSLVFQLKDSSGLGKQACYYESTMQKEFFFRLNERKQKQWM